MADRPPLALDPDSDPPRRLPDPRLETLRDWVRAVDQKNAPAMLAATRTLRALGISIVATGRARP